MKKPLFLCYPKCGTCQKAAKWLKTNNIDIETRDIVTENPTIEELSQWIPQSGIPVNKFFNTSGLRYKELGLKDVVKNSSEKELIKLLASEGKLVKRPILITDKNVLVGYNEDEYKKIFAK